MSKGLTSSHEITANANGERIAAERSENASQHSFLIPTSEKVAEPPVSSGAEIKNYANCNKALCRKAGVGLRSIAEPVMDTTSDFAELVIAKLECRRIKERTARGRIDAKTKGVKFGRKPKLTPHQQHEAIKRRDTNGETLRSIARSYNVSAVTISRLGA
jgi:hypothetical protein